MCKKMQDAATIRRIIDYEKRDCPRVYAIMERTRDNVDELVGLIKEHTFAEFDVYEYDDGHKRSLGTRWADDAWQVMRKLDLTPMHYLKAC